MHPSPDRSPGLIEPSERMTAGVLCSRRAARVPTGGLSQATTAISPATPLAARCTRRCVVDELAADEREAHLRRAVELAVGDAQGERRRDQAHRQVVPAMRRDSAA